MKKFLLLLSAMLVSLSLAAGEMKPLIGIPLDYSNQANWMFFDGKKTIKHAVDVFYLYPTSVSAQCKTEIGEVEKDMKHAAMFSYLKGASCMASYTNVYAPYYRQLSGVGIMKAKDAAGMEKMCRESVVRTDVYAALDYYFKNQNNGRPFILAGHSQGSCNLKFVLSEYMKEHPEYLKRMVACYAIGYYFPESWFQANPHIKKATGETDTGVLISWNSELSGATQKNICIEHGSFTINPLNWKTDETPAGIEQNRGSMNVDPQTQKQSIGKGKTGARIDLKRGALICDGKNLPVSAFPIFGDKSVHPLDWALFYENIRVNAQKRIKAYFSR